MRTLSLFAFTLFLLPLACNTEPATRPAQPAETAAELPFEDFLRACGEASGWNFTYDAPTAERVKATRIAVTEPLGVPAEGFEGWFHARIQQAGFEAHTVGPDSLKVMLLSRAAVVSRPPPR